MKVLKTLMLSLIMTSKNQVVTHHDEYVYKKIKEDQKIHLPFSCKTF